MLFSNFSPDIPFFRNLPGQSWNHKHDFSAILYGYLAGYEFSNGTYVRTSHPLLASRKTRYPISPFHETLSETCHYSHPDSGGHNHSNIRCIHAMPCRTTNLPAIWNQHMGRTEIKMIHSQKYFPSESFCNHGIFLRNSSTITDEEKSYICNQIF